MKQKSKLISEQQESPNTQLQKYKDFQQSQIPQIYTKQRTNLPQAMNSTCYSQPGFQEGSNLNALEWSGTTQRQTNSNLVRNVRYGQEINEGKMTQKFQNGDELLMNSMEQSTFKSQNNSSYQRGGVMLRRSLQVTRAFESQPPVGRYDDHNRIIGNMNEYFIGQERLSLQTAENTLLTNKRKVVSRLDSIRQNQRNNPSNPQAKTKDGHSTNNSMNASTKYQTHRGNQSLSIEQQSLNQVRRAMQMRNSVQLNQDSLMLQENSLQSETEKLDYQNDDENLSKAAAITVPFYFTNRSNGYGWRRTSSMPLRDAVAIKDSNLQIKKDVGGENFNNNNSVSNINQRLSFKKRLSVPPSGSPDDKKHRIILESIRAQNKIARKDEVNLSLHIQGSPNPFHIRKLSNDITGDPNAYKDQCLSKYKFSKLDKLPTNYDISRKISQYKYGKSSQVSTNQVNLGTKASFLDPKNKDATSKVLQNQPATLGQEKVEQLRIGDSSTRQSKNPQNLSEKQNQKSLPSNIDQTKKALNDNH